VSFDSFISLKKYADQFCRARCRIQRCVFKILISVFLSREFKHDETNRAWWTGVRQSRAFAAFLDRRTPLTSFFSLRFCFLFDSDGTGVVWDPPRSLNPVASLLSRSSRCRFSQPTSWPGFVFFASRLSASLMLLSPAPQHLLLFILTIPCLIPGLDIMHSTMLCTSSSPSLDPPFSLTDSLSFPAVWLRPSKQIRSPIFSFKQRALRRTIIFKCVPPFAHLTERFELTCAFRLQVRNSLRLRVGLLCRVDRAAGTSPSPRRLLPRVRLTVS
jgi:1,3-beta-glucan synthase